MRCLFLPDNLMSSMQEEQCLFQSLTTRPFRKIFPIFKTENSFTSITIYPPIAIKGYIVRPCNIDTSCILTKSEKIEGFMLGYAGNKAKALIEEIPNLIPKARLTKFKTLSSKSWYFAQIKYKNNNGNLTWQIQNIKWQKQKTT